jgi:hypothetical protein
MELCTTESREVIFSLLKGFGFVSNDEGMIMTTFSNYLSLERT